MVAVLQKAVHGYDLEQYLGRSADLLAGFVLPAAQLAGLTPAQLHSVHGLGFPGSPFPAAPEHVDVLRFPAPSGESLHVAAEPEVRDRPPYTGTGFAGWEGGTPVPVYYLDPVRVPAGAELWRISGHGTESLLGVYPDAASGWVPVAWDGPAAQEKLKGRVAILKVPALRERPGDLGLLLDHLLKEVNTMAAAEPVRRFDPLWNVTTNGMPSCRFTSAASSRRCVR